MIRDTYRGHEINIKREKCKDGSSFLSYDIRRPEDNAKLKSGLEFSGCTMPVLMNALKILVDEMIERALADEWAPEDEYDDGTETAETDEDFFDKEDEENDN